MKWDELDATNSRMKCMSRRNASLFHLHVSYSLKDQRFPGQIKDIWRRRGLLIPLFLPRDQFHYHISISRNYPFLYSCCSLLLCLAYFASNSNFWSWTLKKHPLLSLSSRLNDQRAMSLSNQEMDVETPHFTVMIITRKRDDVDDDRHHDCTQYTHSKGWFVRRRRETGGGSTEMKISLEDKKSEFASQTQTSSPLFISSRLLLLLSQQIDDIKVLYEMDCLYFLV